MEEKTSKEWYNEVSNETGIIILDPDGWDRSNYEYDFNVKKITKEEFDRKLFSSTVILPMKKN